MNETNQRSLGHRWMHIAAIFGWCFVIAHLVTVAITCLVEGFNWGANAWILDTSGFLAGLFFATQCWQSSRTSPNNFGSGNFWILIWAAATLLFRIVDTLMLFGILKWSEVYVTPDGPVLLSNVVSEVIIGMTYTITALVAATMLLRSNSSSDAG